ncbi:MAG: DUF2953 domain-containing protein [Hyphomicrobiales bacterium]|nr:DUF2953 domain-containing protein [Hyphomicrobiales bacterium]
MATVALWIVAAIGVLLIAVVSLPLRIRLRARSTPRGRIQVHVAAFGGFVPAICVIDSDRWRAKPKREEKDRRTSRTRNISRSLKLARQLPSLLSELIRRFRIFQIRAEGEFGLDDPADTGVVFGLLAPFVYGIPRTSGISLDVRPVFGQPCLSGRLDATVAVSPATLLPPVFRFAWRTFGPQWR